MKTNELMIGDWIYDTVLKCNIQVVTLSLSGIKGDCHDNVWNENTFEPIPLTAEILFKNFEGKRNIFGLRDSVLDENFSLEDRGSRLCLVRTCNDYIGSKFWVCDIMYVHQLQHALKLFNIEKEIEL